MDLKLATEKYDKALDLKASVETVDVQACLNRVTAEPVFALLSSPHYNASAMDGIAVRFKDTEGASEVSPMTLAEGKDYVYVNTGNPVPGEFDAVIMIEDVIEAGEGVIRLIKSAVPWQHIRQIGEDIIVGDMILPSFKMVRSIDLGAMISAGIKEIKVLKQPVAGIIPTGSEIVKDSEDIIVGEIIDSNSHMLQGLVSENGGIGRIYEPVRDEFELLKEAIRRGVEENDIVIVNAGSSAGSKDYTVHAIDELGEVIVHGIAIKPGKPTILGIIEGKPVIGIPGYPVSAYFAFEHFVKPVLCKLTGRSIEERPSVNARLSKRLVSSFKHEEKVRVNLGFINGGYVATPLDRGAGVTMSLVKADGIVTVMKTVEGIEAAQEVEVELLKSESEIRRTVLSVGGHDLLLDIIADWMPLSSSYVGSMGGIMALRRGECHIAPVHLLDAKDGSYNESYVKRYFKGKSMVLVKGVRRLQVLMVAKGNPLNLSGIEDLALKNARYINRQNGAGTRVLLDYLLEAKGMAAADIRDYEREVTTHLAVAIAIKQNTADAGLGILSAAKAMNLDFIPVGFEEFDFLMEAETLENPRIVEFTDILKSEKFRKRLTDIGGYEFDRTGEIIRIG